MTRRGCRFQTMTCSILCSIVRAKGATKFDSAGRLVLESKDHIRERLGLSPDLADAAALTFALDFNKVAEDSEYRWRPVNEAGSDAWMGA
jgi:hypothetical protein